MSLFIPWSLITKISINSNSIGAAELEVVLQLAYNVHTLELIDEGGILSPAILYNKDNLGTILNLKVSISRFKEKYECLINNDNFYLL